MPIYNRKSQKVPRILVVDDVATNRLMVEAILKGEGVEIVTAANGMEALAAAAANLPDLILLDVMMPGMDGYEVCRKIKEYPERRLVPVIFLTSCSETHEVVKGFEAGCVDYVTKPFRAVELLARVRTHLQLHQLRSLLPTCMHCHHIRDEDGQWEPMESYIHSRAGVSFSHGVCPACMKKHYPDYAP